MKDIIAKLKQRLTARRADAATRYWQTIQSLASDKLSERAAETALEEVEALLPEVGKTTDDIETDLGLVRAYEAAKAAHAEAADGRGQAADLSSDAARLEARARELEGETEQMHAKALEARGQAKSLTEAAALAAQDLASAERRLVAAGHRDLAGRAAEAAQAREIERLLGELRSLDVGLTNWPGAAADGARMGPERARAAYRAQVVAKLRALGVKDIPPDREIERLLADLRDLDRGFVKGQPSATYALPESRKAYRAQIVSKLRALGVNVSTEPVVTEAG